MILSKKNVITILLAIVFIGTFLRFYKLGENSFNADEFLDINSSFAYTKTGVWQNWDFNFEKVNTDNVLLARDERAWIYKWQVAELFKFLPPTESTARTVSVFWGIISMIAVFFVAKYFTRKYEIGLVSAFLFAISVSGIIFDRRLRMYAMFFAVFLLFSWFLFRFLEEAYTGENKLLKFFWKKFELNLVFLIPAAVFGVISMLTHQLTANIVFIFIFYAIIQIILGIKNKKSYVNKYSEGLGVLLVSYLVGIFMFPDKVGAYTAGLQLFKNHYSYFSKIFVDYNSAILATIFFLVGSYYLYKKQNLKKETLWIAVSFIGTLFLAVFVWDRNAGDQYIFFVQSFEIILISSGVYFLAVFLKDNVMNYKKITFPAVLALSLLLLPNFGYFFQDTNTYSQTSESDNPDYRKIFTYFKKSKDPEDVLITRKFRNYYWSGAKTKVFDFGGELSTDKFSLEDLKRISTENKSGWFIFTDNDEDYISNDAITYAVKNFEKVSNVNVRGKVSVYRWKNN